MIKEGFNNNIVILPRNATTLNEFYFVHKKAI